MNNKNSSIETDYSVMALCSVKSVSKSVFLYAKLQIVEEN